MSGVAVKSITTTLTLVLVVSIMTMWSNVLLLPSWAETS